MKRYLLPLLAAAALHSSSDKVLTLPSFDHGGGLFHNFMNVIGFLDYCETNQIVNYRVDFGTDGHYYTEENGDNWWSYYFEPIEHQSHISRIISHFKNTTKKANSDLMAQFVKQVEFVMDKERANALIERYVRPTHEIRNAVDQFAWDHFRDYHVIGIHYRGTDKMRKMQGYADPEAPPVTYHEVFEQVDSELSKWTSKATRIFIATDCAHFLNAAKKRYPSLIVHTQATRSEDGKPLHYNNAKVNYYQQGKETVIDCLLLASCHHLIVTSSNLNLCATFFNPKMSVHTLSNRL
ncbi:MAG: nodulation protein NodZ [Simkaniaceae bacterium]|nr:nodulation protein NodZ [Simkaniaceae bacterium]